MHDGVLCKRRQYLVGPEQDSLLWPPVACRSSLAQDLTHPWSWPVSLRALLLGRQVSCFWFAFLLIEDMIRDACIPHAGPSIITWRRARARWLPPPGHSLFLVNIAAPSSTVNLSCLGLMISSSWMVPERSTGPVNDVFEGCTGKCSEYG